MSHTTPCQKCGHTHSATSVTVAVGRFWDAYQGYRALNGKTLYATREEAEAEWCESMQRGSHD